MRAWPSCGRTFVRAVRTSSPLDELTVNVHDALVWAEHVRKQQEKHCSAVQRTQLDRLFQQLQTLSSEVQRAGDTDDSDSARARELHRDLLALEDASDALLVLASVHGAAFAVAVAGLFVRALCAPLALRHF